MLIQDSNECSENEISRYFYIEGDLESNEAEKPTESRLGIYGNDSF